MSEQEKDSILEMIWDKYGKKFKRFQIIYGLVRLGVILIGMYWMLEQKGKEILATPAQQKATAVKVDSGFKAHDAFHSQEEKVFLSLHKSIESLRHK